MTLTISVFNVSYIYLQGFSILPTLTSQEMLETVPMESSSQGDLDFDVLSNAHGHLMVARREREMCTEVSVTKMQLLPGLGPEGVMGSNY